ncbi:uroporphyrinogen-III synthase [Yoonia sp. 2307UL14-13]|uniref:uroporphyrinogen-III synthase n=1 Tax=Yoonia sp. 2307UL14-13 TaxID=3126506 RepID=UPI00309F9306
MTPTVLITRPEAQGHAFAAKLRAAWDGAMDVVVSPLLRIAPIAADLPPCDAVILTSANGVAQAVRLGLAAGTTAYCVGPTTADAARDAGFLPVVGPGDAAGTVAMVCEKRPSGRLIHIRGEHARGDIAKALTRAGLTCADVVAYRQEPVALNAAACAAVAGDAPIIAPVFSPRTAKLLAEAVPFRAPLHVVAISEAAVPDLAAADVIIAPRPDGGGMLDATIIRLNALSNDVV